ncbi:MAG TPA: hypothetical protein VFU96_02260 [Acidimicrobiia bacterium]|nr:hypothetical protein [Acidimicrobiia bacterium]
MIVRLVDPQNREQRTLELPPGIIVTPECVSATGGDGNQDIATSQVIAAHSEGTLDIRVGWREVATGRIWPELFIHSEESIFSAAATQYEEV